MDIPMASLFMAMSDELTLPLFFNIHYLTHIGLYCVSAIGASILSIHELDFVSVFPVYSNIPGDHKKVIDQCTNSIYLRRRPFVVEGGTVIVIIFH